MKYKQMYLNEEDTEIFYQLLEEKKGLITKAQYKVHIPKKLHQEVYRYVI